MSTSLRKDFVCYWNNYNLYTFACCLALQPTYPSRLGPRQLFLSFYKHTFMSEKIDPFSANFSDLGAVLPTKKLYKNLLQSTRLGWYMTKLLTYSLMGLGLGQCYLILWFEDSLDLVSNITAERLKAHQPVHMHWLRWLCFLSYVNAPSTLDK